MDEYMIYDDAELVSVDSEILNFKIKKIVKDADFVYFSLPFLWNEYDINGNCTNKKVDDPLTIYWTATFAEQDHSIVYKNSVSNLIKSFCQSHIIFNSKSNSNTITKETSEQFKILKNALQKEIEFLNEFIDNAID